MILTRHKKSWLIFVLVVVVYGLLNLGTAKASDPRRKVVHLLEGDPAPYSGDLVQPVTLLTLVGSHKKLGTMKRKLVEEQTAREIDRKKFESQLEAMRIALDASEKQKVPPVDEPGFFEHPVVLVTLGVVVGGLVTYGGLKLGEELDVW